MSGHFPPVDCDRLTDATADLRVDLGTDVGLDAWAEVGAESALERAGACDTLVLGGVRIGVVRSGAGRLLVDWAHRRFLRLAAETPLDIGVLALPWTAFERVQRDGATGALLLRLGPASWLRVTPDAA